VTNCVPWRGASFEEAESSARRVRRLAVLPAGHASLCAALVVLATLFAAQQAHAAVTEAWVQRYSNVLSNSANFAKVVPDAAGNIIVAGTTVWPPDRTFPVV